MTEHTTTEERPFTLADILIDTPSARPLRLRDLVATR